MSCSPAVLIKFASVMPKLRHPVKAAGGGAAADAAGRVLCQRLQIGRPAAHRLPQGALCTVLELFWPRMIISPILFPLRVFQKL